MCLTSCRYEVLQKEGFYFCTGPQHIDGFYTVLDGRLESRIPQGAGKEDFVRVLGPGDHWGERTALSLNLTQGELIAIDDTKVLVIETDVFRAIRAAISPLYDYLKSIDPEVYAPGLRDLEV